MFTGIDDTWAGQGVETPIGRLPFPGDDSQRIHLSFIIFGDVRSWRNWQTHQLEVLAVVIPWRFESSRPHHPIRGLEFA
jgi:hypothetical protein